MPPTRPTSGELVRQYDDDGGPEGPAQSGALSFDWPVPCEVSLETYVARDRRLVIDGARSLGSPPLSLRVPVGSHRLRLTSGRGTLHRPIFVGPNASLTVGFDRPKVPATSVGEVLVPGGEALVDLGDGLEVQEVEVATFVIQARPVTLGECPSSRVGPRGASGWPRHHTPRGLDEAAYFRWDGDSFVPLRITEYGDDTELLRALPVFGVSGHSAPRSTRRGAPAAIASPTGCRPRSSGRRPAAVWTAGAIRGATPSTAPTACTASRARGRRDRCRPPVPRGLLSLRCARLRGRRRRLGHARPRAPLPLSRATGAVTRGGSTAMPPRPARAHGVATVCRSRRPGPGSGSCAISTSAPDHDEGLLRDTESRPPSGRTARPR